MADGRIQSAVSSPLVARSLSQTRSPSSKTHRTLPLGVSHIVLTDTLRRPIRSLLTSVQELSLSLRSEEHTSELQSLMRISYAVFCLKKKPQHTRQHSAKIKY